jgi:hypothetical protein
MRQAHDISYINSNEMNKKLEVVSIVTRLDDLAFDS